MAGLAKLTDQIGPMDQCEQIKFLLAICDFCRPALNVRCVLRAKSRSIYGDSYKDLDETLDCTLLKEA